MGNDFFITEDVTKQNLKIAMFVSGIIAIFFTIVFLISGLLFNNIPIIIMGCGLTLVGTAITHVIFGLESKSSDLPDYVIKINNDDELKEVSKKYNILQEIGRGMYLVSKRSDQEVEGSM